MDEIISLDSWKGKGELDIKEELRGYVIREPRQEKETGEIKFVEHFIPKYNVDVLRLIIESKCDSETVYGYHWTVLKIIEAHDILAKEKIELPVMINAFSGGRYRSRYYFPFYYYPLKILEKQGVITYYGRGGIQRRTIV